MDFNEEQMAELAEINQKLWCSSAFIGSEKRALSTEIIAGERALESCQDGRDWKEVPL